MMPSNCSSIPTKAPWNHIMPSTSSFHWNQSVDPASCREVYDALHYITSASWPAALHPISLKVPSEPHRAHVFSSTQRHALSAFLMPSPMLLRRPLVRYDEPKPLASTQETSEREAPHGVNNPIMEHKAGWPTEQPAKPSLIVESRAEPR